MEGSVDFGIHSYELVLVGHNLAVATRDNGADPVGKRRASYAENYVRQPLAWDFWKLFGVGQVEGYLRVLHSFLLHSFDGQALKLRAGNVAYVIALYVYILKSKNSYCWAQVLHFDLPEMRSRRK